MQQEAALSTRQQLMAEKGSPPQIDHLPGDTQTASAGHESGHPMNMDTVVECVCGHNVGLNELLAHGFVMVGETPAHVYLKYRCAECGHEGVELLDYERWNAMMKEPDHLAEEVTTLVGLGPIRSGEMLEFADELAQITDDHFAELYSI